MGLRTEHILKPINLTTYYHKIIGFIRCFVQSVAPRIHTEIIEFTSKDLLACSRGHSCMQMAVEKPNLSVFSYKLQGVFNSSVFSELPEHTESKIIILQFDLCKDYFVNFAYMVDKEAEMIDIHQNLTVLSSFCPEGRV